MPGRRRSTAAPGSSRRGAGRRPAKGRATTRRTTRVAATPSVEQAATSRAKLTGRAAILLFVVAVLSVSYASSMRAWIHQRGEINQLNADIAEGEAAIAELRLEKQRWKDPAYVEIQARLRFGWLIPGETGYRVIGADGEVLSAGQGELSKPADVLASADEEWWEHAWGSVVESGKTPDEIAAEAAAQRPEHQPAKRITPGDGTPGDGTPGDGTTGDGTPGGGTTGGGTTGGGTTGGGTTGDHSPGSGGR